MEIFQNSNISPAKLQEPNEERLIALYRLLFENFNDIKDDFVREFQAAGLPHWLCAYNKVFFDHAHPKDLYANSAITVLVCFDILKPGATKDELRLAATLGWAHQTYQMFNLVLDDQVDKGYIRHGQQTWAAFHEFQQNIVVFDALMLQSGTFAFLKKYFGSQPDIYLQLLELFLDVIKGPWLGNRWEAAISFSKVRQSLELFQHWNFDTYKSIGCLKHTSANCYLPIAIAMVLAGYRLTEDEQLFKMTRHMCDHLSYWIIVKDDLLDSFPKNTQIDSVDTDIRSGQLSYLFLKAYELCKTEGQQRILMNNYGVDNNEAVKKVKDLYLELNLPQICRNHLDDFVKDSEDEIKTELGIDHGPGKAVYVHYQIIRNNFDF